MTEPADNQPEDQGSNATGNTSANDGEAKETGRQDVETGGQDTAQPDEDLANRPQNQQGPGWLPALMAMGLLAGVAGFICCGVTT